jgi:hypothetical protein
VKRYDGRYAALEALYPSHRTTPYMLPVLQHCAEKTWVMRDLVPKMADDLKLNEAERDQRIPNGSTTVIASRVH